MKPTTALVMINIGRYTAVSVMTICAYFMGINKVDGYITLICLASVIALFGGMEMKSRDVVRCPQCKHVFKCTDNDIVGETREVK